MLVWMKFFCSGQFPGELLGTVDQQWEMLRADMVDVVLIDDQLNQWYFILPGLADQANRFGWGHGF